MAIDLDLATKDAELEGVANQMKIVEKAWATFNITFSLSYLFVVLIYGFVTGLTLNPLY